jgi:hypothetical protein
VGLASCSGSQQGDPASGSALPADGSSTSGHHARPNEVVGGGPALLNLLKILLGDASLPSGGNQIQSINLGVDAIEVTDPSGNVTTVAQYNTPQVVNVLAYQGGNNTSIGQGNVAPTSYSSLTIVVDTRSSTIVTNNGESQPLDFELNQSSQSTSGFGSSTVTTRAGRGKVAITYNQGFQLVGSSMNIDVDFNALESIYPTRGGGTVYSRPSLTVAQDGMDGSISGNVQNSSGGNVTNAVVVATDANGNADATGVTDQNGNFLLHTLVAGTYQLTVYNQYQNASGWQVNAQGATSQWGTSNGPSATVTPGQTTAIGTIQD